MPIRPRVEEDVKCAKIFEEKEREKKETESERAKGKRKRRNTWETRSTALSSICRYINSVNICALV